MIKKTLKELMLTVIITSSRTFEIKKTSKLNSGNNTVGIGIPATPVEFLLMLLYLCAARDLRSVVNAWPVCHVKEGLWET